MGIGLIVVAGVLVIVIGAIIVGIGRWVVVEKLGWFASRGDESQNSARIAEVERQLEELKATQSQSHEGVADLGTEELAKAAGPDTPGLLEKALQLQSENKEREAIDALYAAFEMDLEPLAKAQLHNLLGLSFLNLSKYKEAEGHYRQALDASRQAGHRQGEAAALGNLGLVYATQGDFGRAEELHKQSQEIIREAGNRAVEAADLDHLGLIHRKKGDFALAEEEHQRALGIFREIGDRRGESSALGNLGLVYYDAGDLERAEELHKDSLVSARKIGNKIFEANQLGNLGNVYLTLGDLDGAEEHLQAALAIQREISDRLGEATQLGNLGLLADRRERNEEACRLLKDAAAIYEEIGAGGKGPDNVRAKLEELGCE